MCDHEEAHREYTTEHQNPAVSSAIEAHMDQSETDKPMLMVQSDKLPTIMETDDGQLFWLQFLYTDLPHVASAHIAGVSIVAKVNTYHGFHGDYAAYIGICPGTYSGSTAADYIARHGEKVEQKLAELLFRSSIDKRWPEQQIIWRR